MGSPQQHAESAVTAISPFKHASSAVRSVVEILRQKGTAAIWLCDEANVETTVFIAASPEHARGWLFKHDADGMAAYLGAGRQRVSGSLRAPGPSNDRRATLEDEDGDDGDTNHEGSGHDTGGEDGHGKHGYDTDDDEYGSDPSTVPSGSPTPGRITQETSRLALGPAFVRSNDHLPGGYLEDRPVGRSDDEDSRPIRPGRRAQGTTAPRQTPPPRADKASRVEKVSNNTGRKSRGRTRKLLEELATAFVDDLDDEVHDAERFLSRERALRLAYLGRQPGCEGLGCRLAATLVRRAGAVGGCDALENWRCLLGYWRRSGALGPSQGPSDGAPSQPPAVGAGALEAALRGFRQAYVAAEKEDATGILQEMMYRHRLASLHLAHRAAEGVLVAEGPGDRGVGVGDASVVKRRLFEQLHPDVDGACWERNWGRFNKRLAQGRRWWDVRDRLGVGIFALIPASAVPHSWVERLTADHFSAWVNLIRKYGADVVRLAGMMDDAVLGALEGRPAPTQRTWIELMDVNALHGVTGSDLPRLLEAAREAVEGNDATPVGMA